jgi:hypothetical protein
MYSKCIVEPLIRHPIEMTASNGLVEAAAASFFSPSLVEPVVVGEEEVTLSIRLRRLADEAIMDGAALDDWTLDPSMSFCVAKGSSYDPGTDLTTMFCSSTPCDLSLATQPETRAEMMASFHRAWTMAMRYGDPSYVVGGGGRPLTVGSDIAGVEVGCALGGS